MSSFPDSPAEVEHVISGTVASFISGKLSIERIVALLTPVFAALSAFIVAWVGKHFPGLPTPTKGDVTALMITGFTGAVGIAWKWLHGRAAYVAQVTGLKATNPEAFAASLATPLLGEVGPSKGDIEELLAKHSASLMDYIDRALARLPKASSAADLLREMADRAEGTPSAPTPAPVAPAAPAVTDAVAASAGQQL